MPGMLELPPLPMDATAGREPVLRLRHAITNTNYYVELFAESAPGVNRRADTEMDDEQNDGVEPADSEEIPEEERVFVPELPEAELGTMTEVNRRPLREAIPAAGGDLEWADTKRLPLLPLTGLARKALQRLGVMRLPALQQS